MERKVGMGREGEKRKKRKRWRRKRERGIREESKEEGSVGGREGVFVILFEMFSGSFMMYPISSLLWEIFAHFDTFPGQTLLPASF